MEATGVYWIVLNDMLRDVGIEVAVVNGRHVKHVPGRKTDVKDCLWISELHSYGLLKKSFIPDGPVKEMRHYMRFPKLQFAIQRRLVRYRCKHF